MLLRAAHDRLIFEIPILLWICLALLVGVAVVVLLGHRPRRARRRAGARNQAIADRDDFGQDAAADRPAPDPAPDGGIDAEA